MVQPQNDLGPVDPAMAMDNLTLLLKPAASLEGFLTDQQSPGSPNYRKWITPDQFGDRFGLSPADMSKVVGWLQSQGLHVNQVARGRHWISFGGTAEVVGRALHTSIHRYRTRTGSNYANATEPEIPAALEPVIAGFQGLDDASFHHGPAKVTPIPNATFQPFGGNVVGPDDVATIYNISPLYQQGIDGTGQTIAIIGFSGIDLEDIRAYRRLFNLPPKDPQTLLVGPNPGINSSIVEADLDIEWSGAIARNATILYVYGTNPYASFQAVVDQNLASIVSMSFGSCELLSSTLYRGIAQQANAQGITAVASSGDQGAATCDLASPTQQASKGPTASFPASLPEVTAVGGTMFNEGTGTFWQPSNKPLGASAMSYIPEVAWNESAAAGEFLSGGGGPSGVFPKPAWQTGRGVPNDGARDLPDISFPAAAIHDSNVLVTEGQIGAAGGTSVAAPIFAGVVALANHYLVSKNVISQPGLGNVNPTLYRMAQTTTDVFHDIVGGDNKVPCVQGSAGCIDGMLGYSAGSGYDLATGLGSADVYHLITEWNNIPATALSLTSDHSTAALGDTVKLTATVSPTGLITTASPSGSITFLINDAQIGTAPLVSSGNAATAVLSVPNVLLQSVDGTVTAIYGGDAIFKGSSASLVVNLQLPTSGSLVVPAVNPNPVPKLGATWPYIVTLNERAGVGTTLTGFTIDGTPQSLSAFTSTRISAGGTIAASLAGSGLKAPVNRVFVFNGTDAGGKTWTQQITVPFVASAGPPLVPALSLTGSPALVQRDPKADPSCPWSEQVFLQEQSGLPMLLTTMGAGSTSLTAQIQQVFGTTRIAAYGLLQGHVCFGASGAPADTVLQVTGLSEELGTTAQATLPLKFAPASSSPALMSVNVIQNVLPVSDGSQSPVGQVDLNFSTGSPAWTASIAGNASWLAVTPASGSGPAHLKLLGSGKGLSNGVYNATVTIQSTDTAPQSISVPVTLVAGTSPSATRITGVSNGASFQNGAAPGAMVNVYGAGLAPAEESAPAFTYPLPFSLQGVSVTVNGISAPLYSVSPTQLVIQVPYETGSGPAVVGVNNNGQVAAYNMAIAIAAPGLFAFPYDAVAGVPVTSSQRGANLLLFMTGEGDVTPFLPTGTTPFAPVSQLPRPRLPVTVTVGGVAAKVAFAGIAEFLVGVSQINITVPTTVSLGIQQIVVTVGGINSQPISVNITK